LNKRRGVFPQPERRSESKRAGLCSLQLARCRVQVTTILRCWSSTGTDCLGISRAGSRSTATPEMSCILHCPGGYGQRGPCLMHCHSCIDTTDLVTGRHMKTSSVPLLSGQKQNKTRLFTSEKHSRSPNKPVIRLPRKMYLLRRTS
jgi:hypothetical protein